MTTRFHANSAFAAGIGAALLTAFAVPAAAAAKTNGAPASEAKEDAKVCIAAAAGTMRGDVTGSILKRKICRTKAKWIAAGVKFEAADDTAVTAAKN